MSAPNSHNINRMRTEPIAVPRTMRRHLVRGLTSLPAGKMVPLTAIPVLREEAVRSGRLRFSFEHLETAEILMNAINVRVMAYFVPTLAFPRFNGSMDQLNRSYEGKPPIEGQPVVPYINTLNFGTYGGQVHRYLGFHCKAEDTFNTAYLEAYNLIWNFRAKNRSPKLQERLMTAGDLAPAFWMHDRFAHIVPDFDQAVIDGQVALNVVSAKMPVRGIGLQGQTGGAANFGVQESTGQTVQMRGYSIRGQSDSATLTNTTKATVQTRTINGSEFPDVWAELQANGITISLSNIELARKTQAFAKLRQQYNENDDWIINLLMDGIHIPDEAFKQPMLLADRRTVFGQSKRYASDAANLTESVVNGMTEIEMSVQLPRVGCGGVIMVVAEIMPDQLFERQEDPFLMAKNVNDLPQYLRDELDPEKVDVVPNRRIDVSHGTPNGTFGYEPLNARWNIDTPRVGGLFYRPTVNTGFDEDRQRIWAVETLNPTLATDFYLCTAMHTKPFVVQNRDPFEAVSQGEIYIEGNTVFGSHLVEATNDYSAVISQAPQTRITKA